MNLDIKINSKNAKVNSLQDESSTLVDEIGEDFSVPSNDFRDCKTFEILLIEETFEIYESSIGTLAMENSGIDYIGGKYSFGDLMESEGYAAVPSPVQRRPSGSHTANVGVVNSTTERHVTVPAVPQM